MEEGLKQGVIILIYWYNLILENFEMPFKAAGKAKINILPVTY